MKEVFKVGYTTYLEKNKKRTPKKNRTSKIFKMIAEHKVMVTILGIIVMCLVINFWLVYKFVHILEMSRVF